MVAVVLCPVLVLQFFDNEGNPAVNGTLLTQVGGVNYQTYSDSGGSTPLPNPIPLNSRGEVSSAVGATSQLFLIPNVVYTFTLFDANGNQLWVANYVDGTQLTGEAIAVLLNTITDNPVLASQVRTAAEISANIMPVNYSYPPLYVDRYGTNTTPGTTDMSAAFNAACKIAKAYGGGSVRYGATSPYLVTSPIDCTQNAGSTQYGFSIIQDGNFTASTTNAPTYPSLIAKHSGVAVFDCSGAIGINFERLTVGTDVTTFPKTCFFLARNSAGSSTLHRFVNCQVWGSFSDSVVYNYGSEDEQYAGCNFNNLATSAATAVMRWTTNNYANLSSSFITIATGPRSTIDHQIFGGQFANYSSDAAADVFYLEGNCDSLRIYAPWVLCAVPGVAGGRSIVYVNMTTAAPSFVSIYNLITEHGGGGAQQNKYGVLFSNDAQTPQNWMIDGGVWDNQTFCISSGANPTLDNFHIRNVSEAVTHGLSVLGTLSDSIVTNMVALTIATSQRNVLTGLKTNMTITTRTNDMIFDIGNGAADFSGGIGLYGSTPFGQQTGFGTPTGATILVNFPGATATLAQTSGAVAEILTILKGFGFITT